MSDRKCKSAGVTDTQPHNMKGARWQYPTAPAIPHCPSLFTAFLFYALRFCKYIYPEIRAYHTPASERIIPAES